MPIDPAPPNVLTRFLRLIRFSHTIFALPFALGALLVAADGHPTARILVLVLLCMIFARTAAMLFNRLTDWSIDQRNPRTAARHLLLQKPIAWGLLAIRSAACVTVTPEAGLMSRPSWSLAPTAAFRAPASWRRFRSLRQPIWSDTYRFPRGYAQDPGPITATLILGW